MNRFLVCISILFNAFVYIVKNLSSTSTNKIHPTTYELEEEGVTLHLTVVDTPGFGDALNREEKYISTAFNTLLLALRRLPSTLNSNMMNIWNKSRVRKCERIFEILAYTLSSTFYPLLGSTSMLFLLNLSSFSLKDMDIEFLQRLCTKVNIIPVIAKADTLTPEEMGLYKRAIIRDFDRHDIRVYPNNSPDNDRETFLSVFQICILIS